MTEATAVSANGRVSLVSFLLLCGAGALVRLDREGEMENREGERGGKETGEGKAWAVEREIDGGKGECDANDLSWKTDDSRRRRDLGR